MDFNNVQKILSRNDSVKNYTKLNYFSSHIKNYSKETVLNTYKVYANKKDPSRQKESVHLRK